jgi:hypothetical protein
MRDELLDRGAFRDFPFLLRDFERMNWGEYENSRHGFEQPTYLPIK